MESLVILLPLAILLMGAAGAVLVWALRSGQYDGLDDFSRRLPDDDR